jgi:hypothetical protein
LLFTSGDLIGTRGGVTAVAATLAGGSANAKATLFHSRPAERDLAGDFRIAGKLTQDGVNDTVMPATCDNPVLLIRSFSTATGTLGNGFAAGIPQVGRDDDWVGFRTAGESRYIAHGLPAAQVARSAFLHPRPIDHPPPMPEPRLAPLAMTFGAHLAASVRGIACAPPRA